MILESLQQEDYEGIFTFLPQPLWNPYELTELLLLEGHVCWVDKIAMENSPLSCFKWVSNSQSHLGIEMEYFSQSSLVLSLPFIMFSFMLEIKGWGKWQMTIRDMADEGNKDKDVTAAKLLYLSVIAEAGGFPECSWISC